MSARTILRRTLDWKVRELDEEKREATFVASTENPVRTYGDPEVLRMKGCRLERYKKNPVLLDTHNHFGLDSVLGSCEVSVEGKLLLARARYATTERGENAWQLVKGGHVRAMSIGYVVNPDKVTRLSKGQREGSLEGPATIANEWELLEVSNVPIPADEDAVRREFYESLPGATPRRKTKPMAVNKNEESIIARAAAIAALQAREAASDEEVLQGERDDMDGDAGERADDEEVAKGERGCKRCRAIRELFGKEDEPDEGPSEGDAEKDPKSKSKKKGHAGGNARSVPFTLLPSEYATRETEARRLAIKSFTPKGLEDLGQRLFMEGKSVEDARKVLIDAFAARHKPLGTTEPGTPAPEGGDTRQVDGEVLLRSLENLGE